jgi:hypothetical protein
MDDRMPNPPHVSSPIPVTGQDQVPDESFGYVADCQQAFPITFSC